MFYLTRSKNRVAVGFIALFYSFVPFNTIQADVNVYSAREEALIRPILNVFTERTGIEVNLLTAPADALRERLQREGQDSLADVLITSDIARLYRAKQAGLLQAIRSEKLTQSVPSQYRDTDGHWFGLSVRARIIAMVADRALQQEKTMRYESLAEGRWRGRICIRSSTNVYNQSLVASMIYANGEDATYRWARALVSNFARPPVGGDRDQVLAVAGGQCDIAVVNSYYLAYMLSSADTVQRNAARKMRVIWPNQEDRGSHINLSGAGITRVAKNKEAAIQLLEFLVSKEAQNWYSQENYEYPIRSDVPISDVLNSWGAFKADAIALNKLGEFNTAAVRLMDRAGWQ